MAISLVLADACPRYLRSDQLRTSLLLAPLGTGTLLERICDQAASLSAHSVTVVPTFTCDGAYTAAIGAILDSINVTTPERFDEFLESQESSDRLLIVDVQHYPLAGFELHRLLGEEFDRRLVRHLVHLQPSCEGAQERVVYDVNHRVRAIRRLYDGVTQLNAIGVSASLVSLAAVRCLGNSRDLLCPERLRLSLASVGVPSGDITASGAMLDLTREDGLLELSERFLSDDSVGATRPPFTETRPGVRIGPGCRIHPTSRIYGPVILHEQVTVGPRAAVIGPAVLGPGAHVEQEAIVSQSVLGPGARARRGTAAVRCVLAAGSEPKRGGTTRAGLDWRPDVLRPVAPPSRNGNGRESVHRPPGPARVYVLVKRLFDFHAALLSLLVLSPLLLLVAVLLKATTRGPVLFGHDREGRDGKVFRCWKFRTMIDGAHAQQRALYQHNAVDGPQFKLEKDPRITRLGHWLRVTNIDELPQLVNVVRGDMSLIGPRPSPFRENQICVPWRNARLSVRPGITGLWQICRNDRSSGDFHQWIYFDTLYVRYLSLGLDLRILLATFLTLGGRWSVPIHMMLPARRRRSAQPGAEIPQWFQPPVAVTRV